MNAIKKMSVLIWLFVVGIWLQPQTAQATHIVGGEMRYEDLGDGLFRIYLSMRRDCYNGAPNAQFDKEAGLGIFDGDGNLLRFFGLNGSLFMPFNPDDTLNEYVNSECKVIGENVCVHTTTYTDLKKGDKVVSGVLRLPYREGGYYIGYQRCCRNKIVNIGDPESVGATYFLRITEDALLRGNTSAKFRKWAPIYLCADRPFSFDHSAIDPDGDSLVYRLCTPYEGGSLVKQKPVPPPNPRTWDLINWKPPYGLNNIMGGRDPLRIDSRTGLLTGTPPNTTGTYLVGVCVEEYRNGRLINIVRREFEFNVRICPEKPIAGFEVDSVICDGLSVSFTNTSSNGTYQWFFDADNDRTKTSTEKNPGFTYSKPGTYRIVLIAVKDSTCIDSTSKTIYVYGKDGYGAEFDFSINKCDKQVELELNSLSFDNKNTIDDNNLMWIIKGKTGTTRTSGKTVIYKQNVSDTLDVTLVLTTKNGCVDTVHKRIPVNVIDIDFIADNIAICFGESTMLVDTVRDEFSYQWSPTTGLSCSDCPDPTATPSSTTSYRVTISDGNCQIERVVTVKVNNLLDIDVLGDSIACTRSVHLFTNGGEISTVQWAADRNFKQILSQGSYDFDFTIEGADSMIYVRAQTENGCPGMDSLLVVNEIVETEYEKQYHVCVGDTFPVRVNNKHARHRLKYSWRPADFVVSGDTSSHPMLSFNKPGVYQVDFTAMNQYGCTSDGAIKVKVEDLPDVAFDYSHSCEDLLVYFTNQSDTGKYYWDFGDGTKDTVANPKHSYSKPGSYNVTLKVEGFCMDSLVRKLDIGFIEDRPNDTVISCFAMPVYLYPGADPGFSYQWSPAQFLNDATAPNPLATVKETTAFSVTITNKDFPDCFVTRDVLVVVPPEIQFERSADTVLCFTDSLNLWVRSSMDLTYEWRNSKGVLIGSGDSILVRVSETETFYVIATDEYGCFQRDSVRLIPYFLDVDIEAPDFLCFSSKGTIKLTNNGSGILHYHWQPEGSILEGQSTNEIVIMPDTSTVYTVTISNDLGCIYEREVKVNVSKVFPRPVASADPDTIYLKKSTQLHVDDVYESYEWLPEDGLSCVNCPDPVATPEMTTTYKVYVTNSDGCPDSSIVTVVVILPKCNEEDVYTPNAFSPNGDGENDRWQVFSNFVEEIEIIIFDRWGEEIFKSTDLNASWDGTYQGAALPPDVYGYRISVKCVDGQSYVKTGNISLLR